MSSDKNLIINLSVIDLLEIYHQAPKVLLRCATKVSVKKESLHKLSQEPIILVQVKNGNYWAIPTQDVNIYWLLPKKNLRVNDFEYQSLQYLFELQGYQAGTNNYFTVKQPAKVSFTVNEWKLQEKGILNFTQTNPSDGVDSEDDEQDDLKQLQLELSELRSQFSQVKEEHEELQFRLSQMEGEGKDLRLKLKRILDFLILVRKDVTENQQINQQEIKSIKNQIETNKNNLSNQNSQPEANNNPERVEEIPIFRVATPKPPIDKSKLTKDSLVDIYNNEPERLLPHVTEVKESEDTVNQRRAGSKVLPLLIKPKQVNGICWIIEIQGTLYLVPKAKLRVNEFVLSTIEFLFDCQNYQERYFQDYTLEKPAEVVVSGENWTLKEKGILKFELLSS